MLASVRRRYVTSENIRIDFHLVQIGVSGKAIQFPEGSLQRMSQRRTTQNDADNTSWRKTLSKAFVSGSEWPDKDELLDVLYWGKQVLAFLIGISWGVIPLHGFLAILLYVFISTVTAQLYVTNFQKMDEDTLGGFWELAKEGFGAAFATFMVAWIGVYSAVHFD